MSAIEYDFMSSLINNKKQEIEKKNEIKGIPPLPSVSAFSGSNNMFALGGDYQTNGSDFTTGMTHIDAGGSHEENPNEGVQMGVDREGTPNLVEEGETVFNDYVYSNRIELDDKAKEAFHVSKKQKIAYSDFSKKLEKESVERPNDPISQAGLKAQLEDLAEHQERQKQEMEEKRAQEAFDALTPEEQAGLMQYAQEQEQAEQEAVQEQAAQEQMMQQMSPEEQAMMQQQMADGSTPNLGAEPQMSAYGGEINKFAPGGPMRNAGTWKNGSTSENWNTYTRNGLRDYLNSIIERVNSAATEVEKNKIRQEAIKTVGDIQQAYAKAYQSTLTPSQENEDVRTLQTLFQNAKGNAYFGNISDNINLPTGHNTTDTEKGGYVDALWGPRTSIRNWGSTEYGDSEYYKDLADLASKAGLVYAPNADWKYGNNQLYGLSMPTLNSNKEVAVPNEPAKGKIYHAVVGDDDYLPEDQSSWVNVGDEVRRETLPNGDTVIYHAGKGPGADETVKPGTAGDARKIVPVHRNENLRYAGLFGPAVGLGMQALGLGKPDTSKLDASLKMANDLAFAKPYLIGDYMKYNPLDRLFYSNQLQANSRATDRGIMNTSGGNRGAAMAGLIANGYNTNNNLGNLYRQAEEYNRGQYERTKEFNRGTNQFNAQTLTQNSQFNADAYNRNRQFAAQIAANVANQKMDADAGWWNGIYGNIGGLFKGIGDLGRENYQHNRIADMAATGIFGTMKPETFVSNGYLRYEDEDPTWLKGRTRKVSKGGRINRKKGGK